MVKKRTKTKTARVIVCCECNSQLYQCSECGEYFMEDEDIICEEDYSESHYHVGCKDE